MPTPPISLTGNSSGAGPITTLTTRPEAPAQLETNCNPRPQPTFATVFEISPEIGHSFTRAVHEELYGYFYDSMASRFPFVTFLKDTISMREKRPFTYVACVAAAAQSDPTLQCRISRDTLRFLGDHMLLRGEKSLDLLQGLLIMVNWYHVYRNSNPQLMNLVHLAKSLLVDLGLNRRGGSSNYQITPSNDTNKMLHGQREESNQHSLEERRACLGTYHVHATLASSFRRLDTMPWSDHIDECCQVLADSMERPSDAYAVALIRLDHVVDRYRNIEAGQQKLSMPLQTYVRLFSADLESFKKNLPFRLQNDKRMDLHVQTSQICLFERIISSECDIVSHKVEALHACMAGIVQYFDSFMSQPLELFPYFAFLDWSTIAHALDIYAKLSFIEMENWDLEYVRNNPGFLAIVDGTVDTLKRVQAVETVRNPENRSTRFKMSNKRLEMFKQWYLSRIDMEAKTRSERLEANVDPSAPSHEANNGPFFNDFADVLWQDLTTDWSWYDNTANSTTWAQQNV